MRGLRPAFSIKIKIKTMRVWGDMNVLTLQLTENRGEGPDLSMKGEAFRLKKILKTLILKDFKDFALR